MTTGRWETEVIGQTLADISDAALKALADFTEGDFPVTQVMFLDITGHPEMVTMKDGGGVVRGHHMTQTYYSATVSVQW